VLLVESLSDHEKRSDMVNLGQVVKDLRAARSRTQKEVDRSEKAIGTLSEIRRQSLGKLKGTSQRKNGSEQESVSTRVFAGFSVNGAC